MTQSRSSRATRTFWRRLMRKLTRKSSQWLKITFLYLKIGRKLKPTWVNKPKTLFTPIFRLKSGSSIWGSIKKICSWSKLGLPNSCRKQCRAIQTCTRRRLSRWCRANRKLIWQKLSSQYFWLQSRSDKFCKASKNRLHKPSLKRSRHWRMKSTLGTLKKCWTKTWARKS